MAYTPFDFSRAIANVQNSISGLANTAQAIDNRQIGQNTSDVVNRIMSQNSESGLQDLNINADALKKEYGDRINVNQVLGAYDKQLGKARAEDQYQANIAATQFIQDNVGKADFELDPNQFLSKLRGTEGWTKLDAKQQQAAEDLARTRFGDLRNLTSTQQSQFDLAEAQVANQLADLDQLRQADYRQLASTVPGMGALFDNGEGGLKQSFLKEYYKEEEKEALEDMGVVEEALGFKPSAELFSNIVTHAANNGNWVFDWTDSQLEKAVQDYKESEGKMADNLGVFLRKKQGIDARYNLSQQELNNSLTSFRNTMMRNNLSRFAGQDVDRAQFQGMSPAQFNLMLAKAQGKIQGQTPQRPAIPTPIANAANATLNPALANTRIDTNALVPDDSNSEIVADAEGTEGMLQYLAEGKKLYDTLSKYGPRQQESTFSNLKPEERRRLQAYIQTLRQRSNRN